MQRIYTLTSIIILFLLNGCKKADEFKQTLDDLPQVSNENQYRYRAAYGVGDTLIITGLLYPEKNFSITIGGVTAPVVKTEKVPYTISDSGQGLLDQVSVIITEAMGIGPNRPVLVNSAGNTAKGANIEIYGLGGEGSFAQPLKLVAHFTPEGPANIYLHCINGKGDIYYYAPADKNLYHIKKDGTRETMLTAVQLQTDQNGAFVLSTFLAGGVNPQGTMAWVSISTAAGYRFCQIDLLTKAVTTLNQSTTIKAPYEGTLSGLSTAFTGIYPDSKGNVYVLIGTTQANAEFNARAIARYSSADKSLKYLFKTGKAIVDMPGTTFNLDVEYQGINLRFYPEEATMYLFANQQIVVNGTRSEYTGITAYDLGTSVKLNEFTPTNSTRDYTRFLGSFSSIKLELNFGLTNNFQPQTSTNFGFMPMPGRRLQFLLYQQSVKGTNGVLVTSFPKWEVVDFKNQRLYQYAPGVTNLGAYLFGPDLATAKIGIDELLNYDEAGHLYMTASQRTAIVKTALQ